MQSNADLHALIDALAEAAVRDIHARTREASEYMNRSVGQRLRWWRLRGRLA